MNKSCSVLSCLIRLCNRHPQPPPRKPIVSGYPSLYSRQHGTRDQLHRRHYSCDSAGGQQHWRWYHDARKVALVIAGTGGVSVAMHLRYAETVPFTGRTHLVVLSQRMERKLGEHGFAEFKEEHASKMLDPSHADTIRVRRIADVIITATRKALVVEEAHAKSKGLVDWVDGLDWEVIVVQDLPDFAMCFSGAVKIIVSAELLHYIESDAEIASSIAHEVGHIVARHPSEMAYLTKRIRPLLPLSPLMLPFFRRDEVEADHIGMFLHTAAGYDPHVFLQVWRKYSEMEEAMAMKTMTMRMTLQRLLNVHPSFKKRLHLLSQPKVMEEALDLHRRVNMI